jgi:kumamolisin
MITPHFKMKDKLEDVLNLKISSNFYYPPQVASLYNFPISSNPGQGQLIGIIELGGGYTQAQIQTYLTEQGITNFPIITDVSIDGATNSGQGGNDSVEVALDIEIIASVCPYADINVYFAPNSDSGFYNAVEQAIADNCNIISISWGAAETEYSQNYLTQFNVLFQTAASKNISIYCSAGDSGSYDSTGSLNVNFPASSTYVTACGGTTLTSSNGKITSETVWNDSSDSATGGGISAIFPKPTWQEDITYSYLASSEFRGLPDVTSNGNPDTGYKILLLNSTNPNEYYYEIIGGTSAASPLWAAYNALLNQTLGQNYSMIQTILYDAYYTYNQYLTNDITVGNNSSTENPNDPYPAEQYWDCCSGWGSPNPSLYNYLSSDNSQSQSLEIINTVFYNMLDDTINLNLLKDIPILLSGFKNNSEINILLNNVENVDI